MNISSWAPFPCKSPTCYLCPNINTNPTITGPNGVSIKIFENFSCNSSNFIYAILRNLCPKAIYIGETSNSIRQRMNGHRSDIKHNRNKPAPEHFNKPDRTLDQGCELEAFLIEFKFEFTKKLQVRVRVRVL